MIKIQNIRKIIESAILTGYVKNTDRPTNIFLIADAESGKSELLEMFKKYPNIIYTNDLSFKPFVDEVLPEVEKGEKSHLIIPDFINVLGHRKSVDALIPCLNSYLAEGVDDLKYYGTIKHFNRPIIGGILSGITKHIFNKQIITWRNNGFLSRVIPVTFQYSNTTEQQIHRSIISGEYYEPVNVIKNMDGIKLKSFIVEIPEEIGNRISLVVNQLTNRNKYYSMTSKIENGAYKKYKLELSKYGFRTHKQMRSFIQGVCLCNNKNLNPRKKYIVSEKDFEDFLDLTKFMNFDFEEI